MFVLLSNRILMRIIYSRAMQTKTEKLQSANKQRETLIAIMKHEGLTVNSWCKKAGIAEGTLRHFLSGTNNSMGADKWELLAKSINRSASELMGGVIREKETALPEPVVAIVSTLQMMLAIMENKGIASKNELLSNLTRQKADYLQPLQQGAVEVTDMLLDYLNRTQREATHGLPLQPSPLSHG